MSDTPIFIFDLDETIFAGDFLSEFDKEFIRVLPPECICEINGVLISMEEEETIGEPIKFHMKNLAEVIKMISKNNEKGFPQYIATFNRSHIFEENFVQKSFDKIFEFLNISTKADFKNPIKTKNVFAFVQKPDEKEGADVITWAGKYGKNIHIIMAIIDQLPKELSTQEKYNQSLSFILSKGIPLDEQERVLFSHISDNLKNVHFFDDNETNILLAKRLGVHAYHVNNLDSTKTLHSHLLEANNQIELSKKPIALSQENYVSFVRKKATNNAYSLIEGLNAFSLLKSEEVIKIEERINLSSSLTEVGEIPVQST